MAAQWYGHGSSYWLGFVSSLLYTLHGCCRVQEALPCEPLLNSIHYSRNRSRFSPCQQVKISVLTHARPMELESFVSRCGIWCMDRGSTRGRGGGGGEREVGWGRGRVSCACLIVQELLCWWVISVVVMILICLRTIVLLHTSCGLVRVASPDVLWRCSSSYGMHTQSCDSAHESSAFLFVMRWYPLRLANWWGCDPQPCSQFSACVRMSMTNRHVLLMLCCIFKMICPYLTSCYPHCCNIPCYITQSVCLNNQSSV